MNSIKSISILSLIAAIIISSPISVSASGNQKEHSQQEVKALEQATFQDYMEQQQLQLIELPQKPRFAVVDAEGKLIYLGEGKDSKGIGLIHTAYYINEVAGTKYFLKKSKN